jgi:hypothetical protein
MRIPPCFQRRVMEIKRSFKRLSLSSIRGSLTLSRLDGMHHRLQPFGSRPTINQLPIPEVQISPVLDVCSCYKIRENDSDASQTIVLPTSSSEKAIIPQKCGFSLVVVILHTALCVSLAYQTSPDFSPRSTFSQLMKLNRGLEITVTL